MNRISLTATLVLALTLLACGSRRESTHIDIEQSRESLRLERKAWIMQGVRIDTLTATVLRFDTVGRLMERTEWVARSREIRQEQATDTVYIHQKDSTRLEQKKELAPSPARSLLDTLSHLALGALIGALVLWLVTLYKHPKR